MSNNWISGTWSFCVDVADTVFEKSLLCDTTLETNYIYQNSFSKLNFLYPTISTFFLFKTHFLI